MRENRGEQTQEADKEKKTKGTRWRERQGKKIRDNRGGTDTGNR